MREPARRQGRQSRRDERISACPCRPASPSRPRSAPITTPTAAATRSDLEARSRRRSTEVGGIAGQDFGDAANPLLVSVRSGARASMPGMMDTVLNLGLNDVTVEALAASSGDAALRLRQLPPLHPDVFGRRARASTHHHFEDILEEYKDRKGYALDTDLSAEDWTQHRRRVQGDGRGGARQALPAGSVGAALGRDRRRVRLLDEPARHHLPRAARHSRRAGARPSTSRPWCSATWATPRATGVAFTRNPSTGEKELYGEFLVNAQGEDVVAGIRTPQAITEAARKARAPTSRRSKRRCRRPTPSSSRIYELLEKHYRDMQDIEFTIERGKLWMLQTRNGKRTAKAALTHRRRDGRRGPDHAGGGGRRASTRRRSTSCCTRRSIPNAERKVIATGLPASPGAAGGEIVFDRRRRGGRRKRPAARSSWCASRPAPRTSTACTPPQGILTARGGMTSHAAVVARGMGKPCVSGAGAIRVDYAGQHADRPAA